MMHIAHLTDDPGLGGVNRMIDALIARTRGDFRHARHVVAPARSAPRALGADIIVVHFTLSWRKLAWIAQLHWRNPGTHFVLVEHSYCAGFEARYVAQRARFRAMLRLGYTLFDRIVSVSPAQAAWLRAAAGAAAPRLRVIAPITDVESLRALPRHARPAGAPLRLCGYGRFAPQKGFDTLIAAMRLVDPATATLRLVGLGPDEAALREAARGLPHVRIEGPAADPALLFPGIDALAIPSRFEPYGCVAFEARAAALPMILSTADGLADHPVPDPRLRVPPEDPAALARAIIFLASQDLAALGAAARAGTGRAEDAAAESWRALFHELRAAQAPRLAA